MRLILRLLGLAAGALLAAILYWWLWTETGPYAWYGSVLGLLGNVGMRWAFALVIVTWLVLLILVGPWLCKSIARLSPNDPKARPAIDSGMAYGLALVPLAVFLLSVYGTFSGLLSRTPEIIPADSLPAHAGILPQTVRVDPSLWKQISGPMVGYPSLSSKTTELYVPIDTKVADNPRNLRVFVRTDNASYQQVENKGQPSAYIPGVLAYEPLTARARSELRKIGQSAPAFGVVLYHHRGALGFWFTILLVHIVPFGILGINTLYRLFRKPTPQPATNSDAA